jgi:hypothetical protein
MKGLIASIGTQPEREFRGKRRFLYTDSTARTVLLISLLTIATFALYYQVHTHPWSGLDDRVYVVDNVHLHTLNWTIRSSTTQESRNDPTSCRGCTTLQNRLTQRPVKAIAIFVHDPVVILWKWAFHMQPLVRQR